MKNALKILVSKSEGRRVLESLRMIREGNFEMDIKEVCLKHVKLFHLFKDRVHLWAVVNTEMGSLVPERAENFLTG